LCLQFKQVQRNSWRFPFDQTFPTESPAVYSGKWRTAGRPDKGHHLGIDKVIFRNEVQLNLGMIRGYMTHVYTQHSMMKCLLKLTPKCLVKIRDDASDWLRPPATRGAVINTDSTTIHQEGKADACIIKNTLVISPMPNVNQTVTPSRTSKNIPLQKRFCNDLKYIFSLPSRFLFTDSIFEPWAVWKPQAKLRFLPWIRPFKNFKKR